MFGARWINIARFDIDWNTIKAEYLAGGISQRDLAEKYKVSVNTLCKKAAREHWKSGQIKASEKVTARMQQKIAQTTANNATTAAELKRKLLLRLARIEAKFPDDGTEVILTVNKRKKVIYRIKELTAAYKDLTENMKLEGTGADIEDLTPLAELLK